MNANEEQIREVLRRFFKYVSRFRLVFWRVGVGQWMGRGPRCSGATWSSPYRPEKRLAPPDPVNYAIVDGEVYCVAGFGKTSDWYRNLLANPRVEVWLPEGWWEGVAQEVTDPQIRPALIRQVIIGSGFAGRAAGLDPYKMSDAELEQATADYCLLHIRRTAPRTGPGGPGDLAWAWPLATMILLPLAMRRRKR
jgi:hypothetical protein